MSPVARWLRVTLIACVAAIVMSVYAPADLPGTGWAPEALRSMPEAGRAHA
ncbi:MAG: hypothetical protein ACXWJ7_02520 [Caldimonas sp.]